MQVNKSRAMGQSDLPPVFIKFIETQPHPFIYILYVLLLCFSGTYIVVTETMWSETPKIFTLWLLTQYLLPPELENIFTYIISFPPQLLYSEENRL